MSNKCNIIAISGKQYSGKDTVSEILLKYLPDYKRIGIGDAIKIKLAKDKNIKIDEIYENKHLYREELIKLGNWGREQSPDYWLKNILGFDKIIVPDLRVKYELDFFKSKNAILIRIESSLEARAKRGKIVSKDDATETALDNYKEWDYIIENNNGKDELESKVKLVAESILQRNCL